MWIASTAFRRTEANKKTGFYRKICIKACLEIEKTQVVCCSHPQNSYFLLNSINVPLWYVNIKIPWILLYKRFLPIVLRDSAKIMARLRNWYCSFYTVTIFVKTRQFPAFCSTITVLKTNWICFVFFKFLWVRGLHNVGLKGEHHSIHVLTKKFFILINRAKQLTLPVWQKK